MTCHLLRETLIKPYGAIMKNELSGMKAFVTVAELGSFSKAAEQLNLTQPALTKKIKKIEGNLNIALFERTTRKIALTQAGKMLLPKAKALIASLDAAIFNLNDLTSQIHDTVTLLAFRPPYFTFYRVLSCNLIKAIPTSKYEFMNKV